MSKRLDNLPRTQCSQGDGCKLLHRDPRWCCREEVLPAPLACVSRTDARAHSRGSAPHVRTHTRRSCRKAAHSSRSSAMQTARDQIRCRQPARYRIAFCATQVHSGGGTLNFEPGGTLSTVPASSAPGRNGAAGQKGAGTSPWPHPLLEPTETVCTACRHGRARTLRVVTSFVVTVENNTWTRHSHGALGLGRATRSTVTTFEAPKPRHNAASMCGRSRRSSLVDTVFQFNLPFYVNLTLT